MATLGHAHSFRGKELTDVLGQGELGVLLAGEDTEGVGTEVVTLRY